MIMTEYVYVNKEIRRQRGPPRAISLCARCRSIRDKRHQSPGRGAWIAGERGRTLSLEMEGREARQRRHSSSDGGRKGQRSGIHCYIVPTLSGDRTNGPSPSTTYKTDFRTPKVQRNRAVTRPTQAISPISPPPPLPRQSKSTPCTPTSPIVQNGGLLSWNTTSRSTYTDHFMSHS